MKYWSEFILKLDPYKPSSHSAWDRLLEPNVLKLDWNETTNAPPRKIRESINEYLSEGKLNWYPDIDNKLLRSKIADYSGVSYESVDYYAGSDAAQEYILRALISPLTKLTIITPTYDNFIVVAKSYGAQINNFTLKEEDDFNFSKVKFINYLRVNLSQVVYICNPNNPTGTLIEKDDIRSLLEKFPNIMFIIDEAYYEFFGESCSSLIDEHTNLIITRTFSKAFGLASFRMGYIISNSKNVKVLSKIRNPKSISSISQVAVLASLSNLKFVKEYVQEVSKAKIEFISGLKKLKIKVFNSSGGNFCLIRLDDEKVQMVSFLEKENIFIRSLHHQELQNYVRITIGTSNQMKRVLDAIKRFKLEN